MASWLQVQTSPGSPVQQGRYTLTPLAQSFRVGKQDWPFMFVWNRPVGVHVQGTEGEDYTLPVTDTTRVVQWTLLGSSVFFMFILWQLAKKWRS